MNLQDLFQYLDSKVLKRRFGMRDGYIISHIKLNLYFVIFLKPESIGIKCERPNLNQFEIDYLSTLIKQTDVRFEHRTYGTKRLYSIWEIKQEMTQEEIGNLFTKLNNTLVRP